MKRTKSKQAARECLDNQGVPLGEDFHSLPNAVVLRIIRAADNYGYRHSASSNGSRARCFYEFANR